MKRSGLPKHVTWFYHRHGKRHVRARRHGTGYYFKAKPGTDEFLIEYQRWLCGGPEPVGNGRAKQGSVSALVAKFYRSADWVSLSSSTQATYRGILERFRADHGDKPVALMEKRHVRDMVAAKANTPAAANNMLRMVRILMRFGVEEGWRKDDPTFGVKMIRIKTDGFHTWSEHEIETFECRWPIGSRERLAFALLLYTGQRRSDVILMGRQHLSGGRLRIVQQKTGTALSIPVHHQLRVVLDAVEGGSLNFLCTSQGQPYTAAGFGNWFREACDAAGLPKGCSAHGLRKAACRRLAEAGCSASHRLDQRA